MSIALAVIDPHTLTRYGLRQLLTLHADIEVVAECTSAADAPAMMAQARPDVVTIDVALPDGDGLRLARELRDRDPALGIVVLTSQHQDDVLFRALETGASAFVAKSAPVEEVVSAIRHAAVAASSFTAAGLVMALARRHSMHERLTLSPREGQVLRLLQEGLSVPAIAAEMFISVSTAKTYVARLYEKLGAVNRGQALMAALHYGLIQYRQNGPTEPGISPQPAAAHGERPTADRRVVTARSLALAGHRARSASLAMASNCARSASLAMASNCARSASLAGSTARAIRPTRSWTAMFRRKLRWCPG